MSLVWHLVGTGRTRLYLLVNSSRQWCRAAYCAQDASYGWQQLSLLSSWTVTSNAAGSSTDIGRACSSPFARSLPQRITAAAAPASLQFSADAQSAISEQTASSTSAVQLAGRLLQTTDGSSQSCTRIPILRDSSTPEAKTCHSAPSTTCPSTSQLQSAQQQQSQSSAHPMAGGRLTRQLSSASHLTDLFALVHNFRDIMSPIHLSAAATQLTKLQLGSDDSLPSKAILFEQLLRLLQRQVQAAGPRELATLVWVAGKVSYNNPAGWALLLEELLANNCAKLESMTELGTQRVKLALARLQRTRLLKEALRSDDIHRMLERMRQGAGVDTSSLRVDSGSSKARLADTTQGTASSTTNISPCTAPEMVQLSSGGAESVSTRAKTNSPADSQFAPVPQHGSSTSISCSSNTSNNLSADESSTDKPAFCPPPPSSILAAFYTPSNPVAPPSSSSFVHGNSYDTSDPVSETASAVSAEAAASGAAASHADAHQVSADSASTTYSSATAPAARPSPGNNQSQLRERIMACYTFRQLCHLVYEEGSSMSTEQLSAVATQLTRPLAANTRLERKSKLFADVLQLLQPQLPRCSERVLAITVRTAGQLFVTRPKGWDVPALQALIQHACEAALVTQRDSFTPQGWAMLLGGLASLGHVDTRVLEAGTAVVAGGCARLVHSSHLLSDRSRALDGSRVADGNGAVDDDGGGDAQACVNTVWACAVCSHAPASLPALLRKLQCWADAGAEQLLVQGACKTLWSMAVLGVLHQEVAVTVSLIALLNRRWEQAEQHFSSLSSETRQAYSSRQTIQTGSLHSTSQRIVACEQVSESHRLLPAQESMRGSSSDRRSDRSNMAERSLRFDSRNLIQLQFVLEELASSSGQGVQDSVQQRPVDFHSTMNPGLLQAVARASVAHVANTPPMLSRRHAHVLSTLQDMAKAGTAGPASAAASNAAVTAPHEIVAGFNSMSGVDDGGSSKAVGLTSDISPVSGQDVAYPPRIRLVQSEQLVTAAGITKADLVVHLSDGRKFAIEVDGPQHYASNHPSWPLGSTVLRNRRMARTFGAENLRVLRVADWDRAVEAGRQVLLLSKLLSVA